jgi:hypothetical protein
MTTSVRVTAHNFPCTVTVTNRHTVKGPTNTVDTLTKGAYVLRDGQIWEGVVTDVQSVHVEEHPADRDPPTE